MSMTWIHLSARRLDPLELTRVGAPEDLAGDELVALADLSEDRRAEAVERGAEAVELLTDARDAGCPP
jgi:hypothetical protein